MLLACLAGCAVEAPTVVLPTSAVAVAPRLSYDDLASVLKNVQTKKGLLIPAALAKRADVLDRQLALLAAVGPTARPDLFPTRADRIAYWYNARAAWSMKLAMLRKFPAKLSRSELTDRRFTLDGRQMSIAEIDRILAGYGDWRIVVAAPGISLTGARLPRTPFNGSDVRRRIVARINEFIADGRRFVIDIAHERVVVPPVIWRFRRELIAEYEAAFGTRGANIVTALLPHVSGSALRRLQDAVGYKPVPAGRALPVALLVDAWKIGL